MISDIELSNRRLVVITDPHIKEDKYYHVYADGLSQNQKFNGTEYVSIFV